MAVWSFGGEGLGLAASIRNSLCDLFISIGELRAAGGQGNVERIDGLGGCSRQAQDGWKELRFKLQTSNTRDNERTTHSRVARFSNKRFIQLALIYVPPPPSN